MLAKKYKLPIREFSKKRNLSGKRLEFFSVKTAENNRPHSRFGIIVSRKVFTKAVERNRAKRTILNFIKNKKLHLISGRDILIILHPNIKSLSRETVEKNLENFFKPAMDCAGQPGLK